MINGSGEAPVSSSYWEHDQFGSHGGDAVKTLARNVVIELWFLLQEIELDGECEEEEEADGNGEEERE